jgi:hypothetical protein
MFVVQVPATIRTSAWRGLARNGNQPKRSMSFLLVAAEIISMAQQARPESNGQRLFIRIRSSCQVQSPAYRCSRHGSG